MGAILGTRICWPSARVTMCVVTSVVSNPSCSAMACGTHINVAPVLTRALSLTSVFLNRLVMDNSA